MGMVRGFLLFATGVALALWTGARAQDFLPAAPDAAGQEFPSFQVVSGIGGTAVGLRATLCETECYTAGYPFEENGPAIRCHVDAVDDQGNVVNDRVLDQHLAVTLDLAESGGDNPSSFVQGQHVSGPYTVLLDDPMGIELLLSDWESEDAILVASGGGLNDSAPVTVHFNAGGSIAGSVTIPPATSVYLMRVKATNLNNPDIVASTYAIVLPLVYPYPYRIASLPPGNYVIGITAVHATSSGFYIKALCEADSPLRPVVVADRETTVPTYAMEYMPGHGFAGNVSLEGRSSLGGTVVAVFVSPVDPNACLEPQELKTVVDNSVPLSDSGYYNLGFFPAGEYEITAYGRTSPESATCWTLAPPVRVNAVEAGTRWVNLPLSLSSCDSPAGRGFRTLLYRSPVQLGDEGTLPVFSWTNDLSIDPAAPAGTIDLSRTQYNLAVEDRCGRVAWAREGIVAPGPPEELKVTYGTASTGTDRVAQGDLGSAPFFQQPLIWSVTGTDSSGDPRPTDTPAPTPAPTAPPARSATPTATPSPSPLFSTSINRLLLNSDNSFTQQQREAADANDDGVIDIADLILFLSNL